jgi:gluconolactonase
LLFNDMPGDHLRRWSASDGGTTFRKPCNMSNGLAYDRQGRLVVCEHATSLTRTESDGRSVPIATHYQGKQLNSPNDVVCRSDGGVYFSDPPYGLAKFFGVERAQELTFQGVYRAGTDPRSPVLLVDDFDRPNGLCFSLDESRLYVNDTARRHIRVFEVTPAGALANGRLWAETKGDKPGAPDGMKLDSAGNVYCTGPGGIHVFDPGANMLEVIETPERTANFARS